MRLAAWTLGATILLTAAAGGCAGSVAAIQGSDPLANPLLAGSATAGNNDHILVRPVSGAVISQVYGCTDFAAEPIDPSCPGGHVHTGIDLAAPIGTLVVAAHAGRVHVIRAATGYGIHVTIAGAGGLSTLYGHLSAVSAEDGENVEPGDPIGSVGSTGNSTGPHLHFEVQRDGRTENPLLDLALP